MIYTIESISKHFNLKRIQFYLAWYKIPIKLIPKKIEVINCNDWLQQSRF